MFNRNNYFKMDGKFIERSAIPTLDDNNLQQDIRIQFTENGFCQVYIWNGFLERSKGKSLYEIETYGWEFLYEGSLLAALQYVQDLMGDTIKAVK